MDGLSGVNHPDYGKTFRKRVLSAVASEYVAVLGGRTVALGEEAAGVLDAAAWRAAVDEAVERWGRL